MPFDRYRIGLVYKQHRQLIQKLLTERLQRSTARLEQDVIADFQINAVLMRSHFNAIAERTGLNSFEKAVAEGCRIRGICWLLDGTGLCQEQGRGLFQHGDLRVFGL